MLPVRMSFSSSRATICSEVRPSGMVIWCCTTLPSTIVSTTSRTLDALGEEIFAGLELRARLEREHAADEDQTVLVDHAFALEQVGDVHHAGSRRDDRRSCPACNGPGASKRDLPMTTAPPPTMRARSSSVKMALPTMTSGLRARLRRTGRTGWQRHVIGLQSGARAARRDAFGLQERRRSERRGKTIWPIRYRRLRLARAEHHPSGRRRLDGGWDRDARRNRGGRHLTRPRPIRHCQIRCGAKAA